MSIQDKVFKAIDEINRLSDDTIRGRITTTAFFTAIQQLELPAIAEDMRKAIK